MIDRDEFQQATQRASRRRRDSPYAVRARYDRKRKQIVVTLNTGQHLIFAPQKAEGLERATSTDLATIEITPSGFGLHFPSLDADLYVPAMLRGVYGSNHWERE
ncbi:MAG TPA: DUF2442 domain-containing protein [Alphaproteobacteria bacterium]|nr:DUF2442 domain-containing protein [Alphaproteobacteria bacterium]